MTRCQPQDSQPRFSHNEQHAASCEQAKISAAPAAAKGRRRECCGMQREPSTPRMGEEEAPHAQTPASQSQPLNESEPRSASQPLFLLSMSFPRPGAGKSSCDLHPASLALLQEPGLSLQPHRINCSQDTGLRLHVPHKFFGTSLSRDSRFAPCLE